MSRHITEEKEKQIKEEIKERLRVYKLQKQMIENIIAILKTFEGKQLNKRIETAIKKQYSEYTVFFSKSYTYFELRVWGNGLNHNDSFMVYLGKNNADVFTMENFNEYNKYMIHHDETIKKLTNSLLAYKQHIKRYNDLISYIKKEKEEHFKDIPYPLSQYFDFDFKYIP